MAHVSEGELIKRARQGDGAAWEALVREHQEPAYRLAYLMLGDAHQAEDVTQEAFIRAYRGIDGFDPTRPFRPWMLSITANLARNQRRSLGRSFAALRSLVSSAPDRQSSRVRTISRIESPNAGNLILFGGQFAVWIKRTSK